MLNLGKGKTKMIMNKKNKKGFTLVELLVVIAILAILASVTVVGYLGFKQKANESNALSEATQARDVMLAALVDGEESNDEFTITYDGTTLTVTVKDSVESADLDAAVDSMFTEIADLCTYTLSDNTVTMDFDNYGCFATWNVADGTITVSSK